MSFERQKRLVERLLDRTRAGELPWQEGVGTDVFQISFPNNSVQLGSESGYNEKIYYISITDSTGKINDTFDNELLMRDGVGLKVPWHSKMEELFLLARRKALKADEAIDNILAEIG